MFYIIEYSYNPNTASCNRLFGYFRQWDKMGIEAIVYYLAPNAEHDKVTEKFQHIKFEYCWNKLIPYKKFIKRYFINKYIQKIIKQLVPGDVVYTYSISLITEQCLTVSGVKVFAEVTEHPKACCNVYDPTLIIDEVSYSKTIMHLDGLFVISNALKEYYQECGIQPSKIHIINMTVDATRFSNVKKTHTQTRYIAYCGTVSNKKDGVDELIKAFYYVVKKYHDCKLMIIGKTPRKHEKSDNVALIQKLHLTNNVIFTGMVSSNEIPQILMNADVLVLDRPDNIQARYGFPTKLGEYLLTGNPVVITSVGDIPLFLQDGVSALIAQPSNAEDFAAKVLWALDNEKEALIIGEKGKQVALKSFNSIIEAEKIISTIQSIVR